MNDRTRYLLLLLLAVLPTVVKAQWNFDIPVVEAYINDHKQQRSLLLARSTLELSNQLLHEYSSDAAVEYKELNIDLDKYTRAFDVIDVLYQSLRTSLNVYSTYDTVSDRIRDYKDLLDDYREKVLERGKISPADTLLISVNLRCIRKDGAYLSEKALQRAVTDPEFFIGLANAIRKEKEQRLEIESCCTEQQLLIDRQKETIEELGKRSAYAETVLQNKDLVDITQIAQDYGLSGRRLNAILHEKRVQYKSGKQWILYAPYKGNGYVGSETSQLENGKTVMRTRWTQKGRLFIHDLLKADGILPVHEIETEQTETSSNIQ